MKCISLWQPWATLIAIGAKRIETRSWSTNFRGPLAIHAAKHYSMATAEFSSTEPCRSALRAAGQEWGKLPRGYIIAVCELRDVHSTTDFEDLIPDPRNIEYAFGNYEPDRFMWLLENIRLLKNPIPFRARQGLFNLDAAMVKAITEAA